MTKQVGIVLQFTNPLFPFIYCMENDTFKQYLYSKQFCINVCYSHGCYYHFTFLILNITHTRDSVQFSRSCVQLFATPWTAARQPSLSITSSRSFLKLMSIEWWWCHLTISSSVIPFSSCLQSFPTSGSFPMNQFFESGGQSIGVSASILPMNIQDWFPLGWTGWISLQSKGLSRVFSNTTVQEYQFFSTQLSL